MIRIYLRPQLLPDPAALYEYNQHAGGGVVVEPYGGPLTVSLPDFNDLLTRMVYQGIAHSLVPPRSYEHQVLCVVRPDHPEELRMIDTESWPYGALRWLDGGHPRLHSRSVAIVEFGRAILYVVPGCVSRLGDINVHPMLEQLASAESELRGATSSFGVLGLFAEAMAGPICFHFTLLDGEPILLGTGPHYTRRRNE